MRVVATPFEKFAQYELRVSIDGAPPRSAWRRYSAFRAFMDCLAADSAPRRIVRGRVGGRLRLAGHGLAGACAISLCRSANTGHRLVLGGFSACVSTEQLPISAQVGIAGSCPSWPRGT